MIRAIARRNVLRTAAGAALGLTGAAVLAACGESQVITVEKIVEKEVPVERVVEKQVPVERVVEKVVTREVPVDRVVTKEVVKEVVKEVTPRRTLGEPVRFMNYWASGARGETMAYGLELFAKQHPYIQIKTEPLPPGFLGEKVPVMMAAGTAPDLFLFSGNEVRTFYEDLVVLDDYAAKLGINLDDYLILWRQQPEKVDLEYLTLNGRLYMCPFFDAVSGHVFNINLFESAGLPAPTVDWTWDNYIDSAKQLTDADKDQFGTYHRNGKEFDWLPRISQNGAWLFSDKDRPPQGVGFDNEGGMAAFEWYMNAIHDLKIAPAPEQITGLATEGITDPFAAGKVGMYPTGIHSPGSRENQIKDRFVWDNMPDPMSPLGKRAYSTHEIGQAIPRFSVSRGTVEDAVELGFFIGGEEFQQLVAQWRGAMPVHKKILASDAWLKPIAGRFLPQTMSLLGDNIQSQENYGLHYWDGWREWWAVLGREVEPAWIGEKSPREALERAVQESNRFIASVRERA